MSSNESGTPETSLFGGHDADDATANLRLPAAHFDFHFAAQGGSVTKQFGDDVCAEDAHLCSRFNIRFR